LATDATGTPTSPDSIPKYNTAVDAPSGLGFNAAMDQIQVALTARASKPAGIVSGEVPVWNGSAWVRSSVTNIGAASLGSGTPDATKALRGDGTWTGSPVLLSDTVLGADTASFDISGIVGTFINLKCILYARTDQAVTLDTAHIRFNNDSGANYDTQVIQGSAATAQSAETFGATKALLGNIAGNTAGANLFSLIEIVIANYANSANNKAFSATTSAKAGTTTGTLLSAIYGGHWRSNTAITRVTILPSAGNFKLGSRFSIYGW
jgi:hypothetical protein